MYTKSFDSPPRVKTMNILGCLGTRKKKCSISKNVRAGKGYGIKADHVHIDTSKITNRSLFLVYFILYKEGIVFFTREHHCLNCRDYTNKS